MLFLDLLVRSHFCYEVNKQSAAADLIMLLFWLLLLNQSVLIFNVITIAVGVITFCC